MAGNINIIKITDHIRSWGGDAPSQPQSTLRLLKELELSDNRELALEEYKRLMLLLRAVFDTFKSKYDRNITKRSDYISMLEKEISVMEGYNAEEIKDDDITALNVTSETIITLIEEMIQSWFLLRRQHGKREVL